MKTKPTIGIIGGTGKMGRFLEKFFIEKGFEVSVSSTKTELTNIELANMCDVVIVSVPLGSVSNVINEIAPYVKGDALLTDVSAVKEEPVKAMLKSKASVVGMHLVFGPTVKSVKKQTVVMCPARGEKWFKWLKDLFEGAGAKVQVSTPTEHDKMMAVIQGLVHFTSIASACALRDLKIDVVKTFAFASPNYRISTDVIGRILAQNPGVYADISMHNKYIKDVTKRFIICAKELAGTIEEGDKVRFQKTFQESSDYLGDFRDKAMKETSHIIEKIVEEDFKNGSNS